MNGSIQDEPYEAHQKEHHLDFVILATSTFYNFIYVPYWGLKEKKQEAGRAVWALFVSSSFTPFMSFK